MLHVARECTGRPATAAASPAGPQLLRFGEFCLYSTDLQRSYQQQHALPPASSPAATPQKQSSSVSPLLMRQSSDRGHQGKDRPDKKTKSSSTPPCEVFLGGSCNPTSWRQDVAIPTLRELGISFYNPQVTHWEKALVEREHQAKSTASVLFFVFDRSTRNVASMVEVAYMSARRRKIMLVLDTYPGPGHLIAGEPMSDREYEELSGGLNTVQDLVERKGIPVFSQLPHALHCTAKILREDLWPQQLGATDNVTPIKYPELQVSDKYSKLQTAFNRNTTLPLSEARHVFRATVGRDLTHDELLTIIAAKKEVSASSVSACSELPLKDVFVTLDDLCCIVAEFTTPRILDQRRPRDLLTNSVASPLQKALGSSLPRRSPRHMPSDESSKIPYSTYGNECPTTNGEHNTSVRYDVYLGGVSADNHSWRETIALPILKKHGLTYCIPDSDKYNHVKILGSSDDSSPEEGNSSKDLPQSTDASSKRPDKCGNTTHNSSSAPDRGGACNCVHPSVCCGKSCQRQNSKVSHSSNINSNARLPSHDNISNDTSLMSATSHSNGSNMNGETNGRLYPTEASYIDQCRVVLFVIASNTRSVSAMALASHYVGLGRDVVLCVQNIPDNAVVDAEELSECAIKDYNRGRSYLTDQAVKDGVPVFSDIAEALECVRQRCSVSR